MEGAAEPAHFGSTVLKADGSGLSAATAQHLVRSSLGTADIGIHVGGPTAAPTSQIAAFAQVKQGPRSIVDSLLGAVSAPRRQSFAIPCRSALRSETTLLYYDI
jgi:hypothetical protein